MPSVSINAIQDQLARVDLGRSLNPPGLINWSASEKGTPYIASISNSGGAIGDNEVLTLNIQDLAGDFAGGVSRVVLTVHALNRVSEVVYDSNGFGEKYGGDDNDWAASGSGFSFEFLRDDGGWSEIGDFDLTIYAVDAYGNELLDTRSYTIAYSPNVPYITAVLPFEGTELNSSDQIGFELRRDLGGISWAAVYIRFTIDGFERRELAWDINDSIAGNWEAVSTATPIMGIVDEVLVEVGYDFSLARDGGWREVGDFTVEIVAKDVNGNLVLFDTNYTADYNPVVVSVGFKLNSVVQQSDKVLRFTFSEPVNHVSASGLNDALNPANYLFNGSREAVSVAHVSGDTVFDVTLDKETVIGFAYVSRVTAIRTPANLPPDPLDGNDQYAFTGGGTRPTIASAAAGERRVDLAVTEEMDPDTIVPSAFTIDPVVPEEAEAVSVSSIEYRGNTQIRLILDKRMTDGKDYAVTMLNTATDLVGNGAEEVEPTVFVGFAAPVNIVGMAFLSSTQVRVTFDQDIEADSELTDTANYTWTRGLQTLAVTVESARSVLLTTSAMQHGLEYQLTV